MERVACGQQPGRSPATHSFPSRGRGGGRPASKLVTRAVRSYLLKYGTKIQEIGGETDGDQADEPAAEETSDAKDFHLSEFKKAYRHQLQSTTDAKELCIAYSYFLDDQSDMRELAKILTHKGKITYHDNPRIKYETPLDWHRKNPNGFSSHIRNGRNNVLTSRMKADIPRTYYKSYLKTHI